MVSSLRDKLDKRFFNEMWKKILFIYPHFANYYDLFYSVYEEGLKHGEKNERLRMS